MQDLMPPISTPDKMFHDGDPTQGLEGTIVVAEWLNDSQGATRDTQQELKNVLAAAGMQPDEQKQNQLLTAIQALVSAAVGDAAGALVPDVHELYITKGSTNPNVKWPGTTWVRIAASVNLRSAKADGSDAGSTVGADTVTLGLTNLPAHAHNIGGSTGSGGSASITSGPFDPVAVTSSNTGAHTHTYTYMADTGGDGDNDSDGTPITVSSTGTTSSAGAHAHTVDLPSHTHSVSVPAHSHTLPAATQNAGGGAAFNIIPHSLIVNIWERTA